MGQLRVDSDLSKKRNRGKIFRVGVQEGAEISSTIAEAIALVRDISPTLEFNFLGVIVSVRADSDPDAILSSWPWQEVGRQVPQEVDSWDATRVGP